MLFNNQSKMADVKMENILKYLKIFRKIGHEQTFCAVRAVLFGSEAYIKSKSGEYFFIRLLINHYGRFQNGRQ